MKSFILIVALLSPLSLQAQTESPTQPPGSVSPVNQNPPPLDPKNMDTSVKPQEDFYLYANGGWIKRNPIPPEFSRWGSFNMLAEQNNDALHVVAEKAATVAPKVATKPNPEKAAEADLQKVGDFYASGMNEKAVETAKAQPLSDELKRIDALKERGDVLKAIAHLHSIGMTALFRFGANQDAKNSEMVIGQAF